MMYAVPADIVLLVSRGREELYTYEVPPFLRTWTEQLYVEEPSVKLINKLHSLFPQYSILWIMFGVEETEVEQTKIEIRNNMNNLVKQIEQYLHQLNIKAELEEPEIFGFDINMENTMLSVRIICDKHEKRVMIFGEAPFNIPKNKMNEVLLKLNDIHQHEYNTAHCFINVENEHIMSQVILNLGSNNGIDYDVFRYGLCDVCYIIDNYYKDFMKVLVNVDPARIAIGIPKKNKLFR